MSGKWFLDHFTESFTCWIASSDNFIGANIYIPKWVDVNGTVYTVVKIGGEEEGHLEAVGHLEAKVTLPNSVITIGSSAFYGCDLLTSINLDNVVDIDDHAFEECGFTSANLDNVQTIGWGAFKNCELESASLRNCTMIEDSAFESSKLKSINLWTVNDIGNWAFADCSLLTSIVASYKTEPTWLGGCIFADGNSEGQVQNKDDSYSSSQFLWYLMTKGLSRDWHAA